jgi:hypothetical protein
MTMAVAMTMPVVRFLTRFPVSRWDHPDFAPVTVMALIMCLFVLDSLANAMLNIIYVIAAGGLMNMTSVRTGSRAPDRAAGAPATRGRRVGGLPAPLGAETMGVRPAAADAEGSTGALDPRGRLAVRYQGLGRVFKDRGQFVEAKVAWQHALDLLTELTTAHPDVPALRRRWCDCANNLAWLLADAADPAVRDPARAVALALETTEAGPDDGTYWNTLGAAHYRAGDFQDAVAALDHATALSDGGTPFDRVFLAMAHARLGNMESARRWFAQATLGMDQSQPVHPELNRLCDEAGSILPTAAADARHS